MSRAAQGPGLRFSALLLLMLAVVLLLIDSPALTILLAGDLAPFLRGERASIRLAVGLDFVVNRGLLFFQAGCFSRGQRSVFYAFSDPLLLVPLPFIDLILR